MLASVIERECQVLRNQANGVVVSSDGDEQQSHLRSSE
jgi:hypothetical protein